MKGLIVSVYRAADRIDCSLNGITSRYNDLTITGDGIEGPFEPNEKCPELRLIYRPQFNDHIAVPVDANGNPKTGGMFGGNFVYTSDSRFKGNGKSRLNPVPVHDRFEF